MLSVSELTRVAADAAGLCIRRSGSVLVNIFVMYVLLACPQQVACPLPFLALHGVIWHCTTLS